MARNFDGSTDQIDVGDQPEIDITGTALTIACWLRIDTKTAQKKPISKWNDPAASTQQYLLAIAGAANDKLLAAISDGVGVDVATGSTALNTTDWFHCVTVKNGTGAGALKVYLDGVEDASATSDLSIVSATEPLKFGASGTSVEREEPLDGKLAEIGIWDRALSLDEIEGLADRYSPAFYLKNLQGYWKLFGNDSPETEIINANNGTLAGTTKFDHPPIIYPAMPQIITAPVVVGGADTPAKRLSMINFRIGYAMIHPLFEVDGAVDLDDRQHLLNCYGGIAFAGAPAGRIMSSLASSGGLVADGGIAGKGGGLAG